MSVQIDTVDSDGNIQLGSAEGLDIRITETDDQGTVDISGMGRVFQVDGLGSFPLVIDPDNATGARVLLSINQLQPLGASSRFYLNDTDGLNPITLWEGYIFRRNS